MRWDESKDKELAEILDRFSSFIKANIHRYNLPKFGLEIDDILQEIKIKIWKILHHESNAEFWKGMMGGRNKRGRPLARFSILVFYVINQFTHKTFKLNQEKDPQTPKNRLINNSATMEGKFKTRKNWQLICAALILIHIKEGIPEMKTWINAHKNDEANDSLRRLTARLKKEYSHFRRSKKGYGKFYSSLSKNLANLEDYRVYSNGLIFHAIFL